MKLHDLRPTPGSHTARTRVGRGIAAGKGKTAGRGTKGQKARAGGSIPPWFEGGQTPLHMRIPKLRGFKNRFKTEYEVVNIGAIAVLAERGAFEGGEPAGGSKAKRAAPVTVNQDVLRAVGLVRTLSKPLKILGSGELATPLFVVADAFTRSAAAKIEAAGGTVSVLEVPKASLPAIGVSNEVGPESAVRPSKPKQPRQAKTGASRAAADATAAERDAAEEAAAEAVADELETAARPERMAEAEVETTAAEPETAARPERTAEAEVETSAGSPTEATSEEESTETDASTADENA
jgi:large subunit ribosomal protein L15